MDGPLKKRDRPNFLRFCQTLSRGLEIWIGPKLNSAILAAILAFGQLTTHLVNRHFFYG